MKRALIIALLLISAPAWAQTPKTTKPAADADQNGRHDSTISVVPNTELVILRAKVEVLQDALVAAQAQIKILTTQAQVTSEIAHGGFAATRARWEPELLKAHGHVADGWTWDWERWVPKAPEPKAEPVKEEPKK